MPATPASAPSPFAPPVAGEAITGAPRAAAPPVASQHTAPAPERVERVPTQPASGHSRKWLAPAAIVLALVGGGLFVWKMTSDDDTTTSGVAAEPTATVVATTVFVESTVVVQTTVVAQTTVAETTTTSPPATTTVVTVPVTQPPVTSPARPPWLAPPVPDPPVFFGAGLAWPVSDPLRGGMNSDQPSAYLQFAQQVFDLMAVDQWAEVQKYFYFQLPGGEVVPYTFDLQNQWPAADRLSLLLVDAGPDPGGLTGTDLTVVVVANFPDSTSWLCGHLYSDPTSYAEVIQRGPFTLMADGAAPVMPETLLNDPAQVATFKTACK